MPTLELESGESIVINAKIRSKIDRSIEAKYQKTKRIIKKAQETPGPIPKPLRWIPAVINIIDDSQDILITALYAAKPLLKRVSTRIYPVVGWALLASDTLNLLTNILSTAMSPGLSKAQAFREFVNYRKKIKNPKANFKEFLEKSNWRSKVGFALQAAQALDTFTGKGIKLGPLMSSLSDFSWQAIESVWKMQTAGLKGDPRAVAETGRAALSEWSESARKVFEAMGETGKYAWESIQLWTGAIKERGGPEIEPPIEEGEEIFGLHRSNIEQKALRFLLQTPQIPNLIHLLDPEDVKALICAQNVATQVFAEYASPLLDERADKICRLPMPAPKPVHPASVQALKDEKIPIDGASLPCLDMSLGYPTIGMAIDESQEKDEYEQTTMRNMVDDREEWSHFYQVWKEAGIDTVSSLTGVPESEYTEFDNLTVAAAKLAEYNIMLASPYSDTDLQVWFLGALNEANLQGRDYPNEKDWINSALHNNLRIKNRS